MGMELKNNQAKRKRYDSSLIIVDQLTIIDVYKRKLYFQDRHRVWIGGEQDLLRHSNAIEICYGTWSKTERSWHLLGRSSVGWFNPAAATRVESRKPTGFILPTIDIEFTRPILPAIREPFCDTHRVHQACLSYSHTKPNKTALPVGHIKPTGHDESVQISTQMHWNRPHALNSTATPPTCL